MMDSAGQHSCLLLFTDGTSMMKHWWGAPFLWPSTPESDRYRRRPRAPHAYGAWEPPHAVFSACEICGEPSLTVLAPVGSIV